MNGYRVVVWILGIVYIAHFCFDIGRSDLSFLTWCFSYGPERFFELILTIVVISLCKFKADKQ